ncbi:hypothetical protein DKM19_42945 [Streptosporangium sp. 'caverna']|nr:hypothetical protein DKM19_42945 [Streptosporangium sp. 'caverna']
MDAGLRDELLRRMERDQEVRTRVPLSEPWPEEVHEECWVVDTDNTAFLKSVIAEHGWPSHDLVGEQAAHAAWLLVQHADQDLEFQKSCLRLLQNAVDAGQAKPSDLAYLIDRVHVGEKRLQVYGTQYHSPDGILMPRPIEDPERLDERRAQVGLEPHADYDRTMRELYG